MKREIDLQQYGDGVRESGPFVSSVSMLCAPGSGPGPPRPLKELLEPVASDSLDSRRARPPGDGYHRPVRRRSSPGTA